MPPTSPTQPVSPSSSPAFPAGTIRLVDYSIAHQLDFERLNRRWLEAYFIIEPYDEKVLQHPDQYILAPGGAIVVAEFMPADGTPTVVAGVVGMMPVTHHAADGTPQPAVEMTKLAVDPAYQGLGIGRKLCEAILQKAQQAGYPAMELVSNRKLLPALKLYQSMGFVEVPVAPEYLQKYERCDIMMLKTF
jgi:ribosomal protein S18 acetylase RimI-like enzyme